MLRKTVHWQKRCQSLGETRNLRIHPLQGRVSNRVAVFFDRAPPHCTGLGGAEVRSCTIHILPTEKRVDTTAVCSPQTSADPARVPGITKSPPRSGKPNEEALKLLQTLPEHNLNRLGLRMNAEQSQAMTLEIQELHKKGAVVQANSHSGGFVSQVFLVPKSDGTWKPVLNLKSLNQFVVPHHFKMESIRTLKGVLQKDDWLFNLDLQDAYLSIPIHQNHQHFLRFPWKGQLWQFKALPFRKTRLNR